MNLPPALSSLPDAASESEIGKIVEAWLRAELPPEWVRAVDANDPVALFALRENDELSTSWFRKLGSTGLSTAAWPVAYGGLGLPRARAQMIGRSLAKYGAGPPLKYFTGLNHAGPTVLDCGDDEQRARFLPPLARGDEIWCQLFSEPGAGSDLAGVATRARRDGCDWIITGQKVWTSYARQSDYAILLARSDPDKPKHQGLTFFIVDMRLPGIEIRPIKQITGMAEFNQVFLDDVVVPDALRVGEVDNGWRVATSTMLSERSGLGNQPGETADVAAKLLARVAADPEAEPAVLDQAVTLRLREIALNLVMARVAHDARAGTPGPEGAIGKVCRSELSQAVSELGVASAGVGGLDWRPRDMGSPAAGLLATRAATVAGGSSEMQRNIIGERVLGLPKDPGVDPRAPWRDLRRS